MEWNPQGRRSRGRTKQSWRRTVSKELENIGRTWGEAKLLANNKIRWKAMVEALCLSGGLRGSSQVKSSRMRVCSDWAKSDSSDNGHSVTRACSMEIQTVACSGSSYSGSPGTTARRVRIYLFLQTGDLESDHLHSLTTRLWFRFSKTSQR